MKTTVTPTNLECVHFASGYRHLDITIEDMRVRLCKEDVKTLTRSILKMYKSAYANRLDDPIDLENDENKEDSFKLLMKELGII